MLALYGIPNCGTVKKARLWLDGRGIQYVFHDFKKEGLDEQQLRAWIDELGWENLLNRRGTTWRKLPESVRETMDEAAAVHVMLESPSIIRRPLLDTGSARHLGFSEDAYREVFA
ncbi:ArsC family reductase [Thiocystis violacea]|uniref:ArsC family reductase n=1 Tax=Thiocystis violacea TaxID=13725 RepID=UPI001908B071|nr:ArsC family reductase [Thiocystis violacea]MBK1720914.1 ArsC family reductase [Thiocystis violacea]